MHTVRRAHHAGGSGHGPANDPGSTTRALRLGLRANAAQFTLLVAVNALVGGMVGQQ